MPDMDGAPGLAIMIAKRASKGKGEDKGAERARDIGKEGRALLEGDDDEKLGRFLLRLRDIDAG